MIIIQYYIFILYYNCNPLIVVSHTTILPLYQGAGKTVFSQILKVCLNLVENRQEELCCVLGMDAYHYPNQYLGIYKSSSLNSINSLSRNYSSRKINRVIEIIIRIIL